MDADTAPSIATRPAPGGSLEPARKPIQLPGERYELRDPFAETTYRSSSLDNMVAKAEQLGSSRFVAVAEDGKRTPIQKMDGEWLRGPQLAALPERPVEPAAERDEGHAPGKAATAAQSISVAPVEQQPPALSSLASPSIDVQAERLAHVAELQAALQERYLIKRAPVKLGDLTIGHTEYRFRGDSSRVAFTESSLRLATDTNSPSIARSMVDVAEARGWKALRVSGHEDFRRMVWLEASARGVRALGHEPSQADLELLRREREARQVNRIEPAQGSAPGASATTDKASGRGGGRKAVLAAIEAVLLAKQVPEKQRSAVLAAAAEKLVQRTRNGQAPRVKVYDRAAPSQRPAMVPTPEQQRSRERAAPTPLR